MLSFLGQSMWDFPHLAQGFMFSLDRQKTRPRTQELQTEIEWVWCMKSLPLARVCVNTLRSVGSTNHLKMRLGTLCLLCPGSEPGFVGKGGWVSLGVRELLWCQPQRNLLEV